MSDLPRSFVYKINQFVHRAPSLSLAATREIDFSFFSYGYLDGSVLRVPSTVLFYSYSSDRSSSAGLPHSDICESTVMCTSSQLFAACHVLHRLLMPRHSPCALISFFLRFLNLFFLSRFVIFFILTFAFLVLPYAIFNQLLLDGKLLHSLKNKTIFHQLWWAWEDLNLRPHAYQACALTA